MAIVLTLGMLATTKPLAPAWSPDHEVLATTKVPWRFVTPEGGNYLLLLNGKPAYPKRYKSATYSNVHTFLSQLAWSPDSDRVALVEKIYSWEYADPFNYDFEGWVTSKQYYLAVISRTGETLGYKLRSLPQNVDLRWQSPDAISLNGKIFDLRADPPRPIP